MKIDKIVENHYIGVLILILLLILVLTMGSSSAAIVTGNASKLTSAHNSSNSVHIVQSQYTSSYSNFSIENQFRSAGSDGYPNPGKIVSSANYTKWVWTNIIIKNNGPDDSNITIRDQGTGFIFYNHKIGWNGWVRINDGTGWKKDSNFDVKTGTGTYLIPNGSSYQVAILGYVNQTGTIRNDVTEISQNTSGPDIYPSASKSLNVPDAAIIRLKGEFRNSLNGSSITSATYKNWLYSVTQATNQGPNKANVVFSINTYGLSSNGTYAVSKDNGSTWKFYDNSFNLDTGIWKTTIPSNGTWLLAVYSKITKSGYLKSNVSLLSQDVYNPYGSDNSRPKCLIVFDDGNEAQYSTAFKYMESLGITGTAYVNGFNIGTDGVLTVAELKEMAEAGWVIGNHGFNHEDLTHLTDAEIKSEISDGINFLTSIGLSDGALNLAYPGGYYNDDVLNIMQSLGVLTGRSTNGELIYSLNGLDLYRIPAYTILNTTSVSTVEGYVDNAIQSGSTVVLLFHNIAPESADSYVYTDTDFKSIINYIYNTGIDCMNINQLYSQSTDVPINIPPTDLDSNTILPGTENDQIFNITSILSVPVPVADVEIKINASNSSPGYGDKITYIIKVINNGPDTAENVTVGDWLNGDYFRYVSDDGKGTFDPDNAIWYVGDLKNGASKILKLTVQIIASNTTIKNTATYNSGSTDDSNLDNNYQGIDLWVPPRTYITVNSVDGYPGDSVNLIITLTNENNNPVANNQVHITINGITYTATTNSNGVATISYKIKEKVGVYNITANFYKTPDFSSSNYTSLLNVLGVHKTPTSIKLNSTTGYLLDTVQLIATVLDSHNNIALSNKTIKFYVSHRWVGSAMTNKSGVAILNYKISQHTSGNYTLTAVMTEDSNHVGCTANSNLTVKRILTNITAIASTSTSSLVSSNLKTESSKILTVKAGSWIKFQALLLNSHNNEVLSGKNIKFYLNGKLIGTSKTSKSGIAVFKYKSGQANGTQILKVYFATDKTFVGSSSSRKIKITN